VARDGCYLRMLGRHPAAGVYVLSRLDAVYAGIYRYHRQRLLFSFSP